MKELLRGRDIKVHYPVFSGILRRISGYVRALDGVDIDIKEKEVVGVVGETGSGKTTLGRAVLRLVEPTAGEVFFAGEDVLRLDSQQLKNFRQAAQIVFQNPSASLNPRKSIGESIVEGMRYHGLITRPEDEEAAIAEILSLVGLPPDVMSRYPHQFSGGQQQRIAIGRAIALNPRLIVCDEAASALDVSIQAQILNLLQDLKERLSLSYLFISHDLSLIRYLSDRVIVLYLGKVMERASVRDLFDHPRHPYTQVLLSAIPKGHPKEKKQRLFLKGEIPSALNPPSGCPFRTRCPYAQPICALPPPQRIVKGSVTGVEDHQYACILENQ